MSLFTIGAVLFFIYVFIDGITIMIPDNISYTAFTIVRRYIVISLIFLGTFIINNFSFKNMVLHYIYLGSFLLMMFADFVIPIFKYKTEGKYKARVLKAQEGRINSDSKVLNPKYSFNIWMRRKYPNLSKAIILFGLVSYICLLLGYYSASSKSVF